jgi:hypothetical protein
MRIMSQGMVLQEHGDRGKVPQQNVKTLLSLRSSHLKIHRVAKGVVVTVIVASLSHLRQCAYQLSKPAIMRGRERVFDLQLGSEV